MIGNPVAFFPLFLREGSALQSTNQKKDAILKVTFTSWLREFPCKAFFVCLFVPFKEPCSRVLNHGRQGEELTPVTPIRTPPHNERCRTTI